MVLLSGCLCLWFVRFVCVVVTAAVAVADGDFGLVVCRLGAGGYCALGFVVGGCSRCLVPVGWCGVGGSGLLVV